jgi:hypothetical protein
MIKISRRSSHQTGLKFGMRVTCSSPQISQGCIQNVIHVCWDHTIAEEEYVNYGMGVARIQPGASEVTLTGATLSSALP